VAGGAAAPHVQSCAAGSPTPRLTAAAYAPHPAPRQLGAATPPPPPPPRGLPAPSQTCEKIWSWREASSSRSTS
jgi:hypothetical protein